MNDFSFTDLTVGHKESFRVKITEAMMSSFLALTGDNNPLHLDNEYARSKGYEGKVGYGMLTASFFSTLVGVHLPGKKALFQSLNVTFNQPVYIGQELMIAGEVTYMNEAFKQIEISATVTSIDGQIFSKAKIKAGLLE